MGADFWTEARVEELKQLWASGLSAKQISGKIGATRGAVLGKVFRLRLEPPPEKQPYNINRVYVRQSWDVARAKARIRERKYRLRERSKVRALFRANGTSPYSADYRKHLPALPPMTKSELRSMLAQAIQNTAAMQ